MSPSWSNTRSCSSGPTPRTWGEVLISTSNLQSMALSLVPQLIVGAQDVVAESLRCCHQILSSVWTLTLGFVYKLVARWPASVTLFAKALNYWLLVSFSPISVVWQWAQIPFLGSGMDYWRTPSHRFRWSVGSWTGWLRPQVPVSTLSSLSSLSVSGSCALESAGGSSGSPSLTSSPP